VKQIDTQNLYYMHERDDVMKAAYGELDNDGIFEKDTAL
jgi:hypothetical protein